MGNKYLPLTVLTFAHFFNDFFQYVIPLFLPLLMPEFGLSYFEGGLLLAVYLGSAVVLNAVMGHVADKFRKRKLTMVLGLAVYGIAVSALQFAQNLPTLVIIIVVMGIGFSSYHPQATKIITDTYRDRKGRFMGLHGIGGSIGFSATPFLLAPLAYSMGWRFAVSFLFIPACVAALLVWIFIKEPEVETVRGSGGKVVWRPILMLTIMYGLSVFVFRGFTNFLPTYFISINDSAVEMGLLTSLVMAMGIFGEPIGGALSDYTGRRKLFTVSLFLLMISLFGFLNTPGLIAILFLVLVGFFGTATRAVGMTYSTELVPPESVGMCAGVVFGAAQGMNLVSTVAVGYMADVAGFYWAFTVLAVIAGLAALISLRVPNPKPVC